MLSKEILALTSEKSISRASGHLRLCRCGLEKAEIDKLVEILRDRPDITSLDLSGNMFRNAGAISVLTLPHIVELDISENNLGDAVIELFVEFLRKGGQSKLATLYVSENRLTDKGVNSLLQAKLGPDPMLARKITEMKFSLSSNEGISDELLSKFYDKPPGYRWGRSCSDEFAALNRTDELSPYHPVFWFSCARAQDGQDGTEEQSKKRKLTEEDSPPTPMLTPVRS
jgi:hypothetical protein